MGSQLGYSILFICSVFISSISQILLKKSALKRYDSKIKEYLNPLVISAYCIFFSCTLIGIIAYEFIPLSMGPIFESTGYVFVSILGFIFLKERISKKKAIGMVIIVIGVLVFSI